MTLPPGTLDARTVRSRSEPGSAGSWGALADCLNEALVALARERHRRLLLLRPGDGLLRPRVATPGRRSLRNGVPCLWLAGRPVSFADDVPEVRQLRCARQPLRDAEAILKRG